MSQIIKLYFLLTFILLLLGNCTGTKDKINYTNPKRVTLVFCHALVKHDIERAMLVSTEGTKKVLTLLQTLDDALPSNQQSFDNAQIEEQLKLLKKAKCEIEENIAHCTICCDESGEEESEIILLKKVENKWLVHMTKEDLQKK
jgi:hypothetical protein